MHVLELGIHLSILVHYDLIMKISLHKETKASEFEIVCLTNVKR
jgi:hypothetical protein